METIQEQQKPPCNITEKISVIKQVIASAGVSIGYFHVGWTLVFPYTTPERTNENTFAPIYQQSTTMSIVIFISLFVGYIAYPPLSFRYGRRALMLISCCPMLLGWTILAAARNFLTVCFGLTLVGFSGGLLAVGPAFIAEVTHPSYRGRCIAFTQVCLNLGYYLGYPTGAHLYWRTRAIIGMFLPFFLILSLLPVPESPKWLIAKGFHVLAKESLIWFRPHCDFAEILNALERTWGERGVNKRVYMKSLFVSISLHVVLRGSGILSVFDMSFAIFKEAGESDPWVATWSFTGCLYLIASLSASVLIDRVGRKPVLLTSCSLCAVSLVTLALYFQLKESHTYLNNHDYQWIPMVALTVYVFAFAFGMGILPYVIPVEILPSGIKDYGFSSGMAVNILALGILTTVGREARSRLWFWVYTGFCFFGILLAFFGIEETNGASLEHIEEKALEKSKRERKATISVFTDVTARKRSTEVRHDISFSEAY